MAAPEHSCTSDVLDGMRQLAHADPKVSWSAPVPNMDNYIIQSVDDILMCVPTDLQDKFKNFSQCNKDAARIAQRLADRLALGVAHKQHAHLKTTLHTNPPSERRRSNRQNAS